MKQPKDFTGYVLLKCPTCKNIMRIDVGVHALKGFAPDGITPFNYRLQKVVCKNCGKDLMAGWGKPIYGKLSEEKSCDNRCLNAKGSSCSCSCGGKLHGQSWSVK